MVRAELGWDAGFCGGRGKRNGLAGGSADDDRNTGQHRWHVEEGYYAKTVEAACDNRLSVRILPEVLNTLPENALLLGAIQWTEMQARAARIVTVENLDGIQGATGYRFEGVTGGQTMVNYQDPKLKELLEEHRSDPRGGIYYDGRLEGLTRRWMHIELSAYAKPLGLGRRSLSKLLSVAGLPNATVAVSTD